MRTYTVIVALAAIQVACQPKVPEVDPGTFACTDDNLAGDGLLQCPRTHFCRNDVCTPRFSCSEAEAIDPTCEQDVTRCDLSLNGQTAAVTCESGLHTNTSTVPGDQGACACGDGTVCVTYAETSVAPMGESYPLFVLADPSAGLSTSGLGITGEREGFRVCTRVCSGERDCRAGHTCRVATVVQEGLQAGPDASRHSIGVCYPDRLFAHTATTAAKPEPPEEPDPVACGTEANCSGQIGQVCQVQVAVIQDHPIAPAGTSWNERFALVPRCVPEGVSLTQVGFGCDRGDLCLTGACIMGRCALLCDPRLENICGGGNSCSQFLVSREIPGTDRVATDLVWACPQQ